MATGSVTSVLPPEKRRGAQERELVEYERYIDQQLTKTARQVQGMDISTGIMCWLAGSLVYLMAAAAADHWLIEGGLGTGGRWLALLGLLVGSGWYLARRVLPALIKRINPVYSAHTIERGRPQLKNSLVNFLLLRRDGREMSELVRDALQAQAASGLAAAPVEHAIDRTPLVRFAMVLLGAVMIAAIYIMFSPKDPLRSAARVILPWASIERPTRFKIQDLHAEVVETGRKFTGGPAEVFFGQRIRITASVTNRGRAAQEPMVLRFTTGDGSATDQELTLEQHERNADIVLPAGSMAPAIGGGLQQSFDYTLTAGDAIAGPFHVKVLAAPSIEIESLEYDYPDYTRLPSRTVKGQGDVNAMEGTRVIVRALANQEIAQAWLDLDCDGRRDATMLSKGQDASVNFLLALKDGKPANSSYLLRFKNTDGFENPQPIRYRIDVTPDLPPNIAWESPREVEVPRELPLDEAIEVMLTAADQDFDLKSVKLHSAVETEANDAKRPWEKELLKAPTDEKWTSAAVPFVPGEHGYQAGDVVLLWGKAEDNRPTPNVAETSPLRIKVLPPRDPAEKRGPNHQPNDGRARQEKQPGENDANPRDQRNEDQQPNAEGNERQPGQEGAKPPQPKEGDPNGQKQGPQEQDPGNGQKKEPGKEKQPGDQEQQGGKEGEQDQRPGQEGGEESGGAEGQERAEGGAGGKGKPQQSEKQGGGGAGQEGNSSNENGGDGGKPGGESGDRAGQDGAGEGENEGGQSGGSKRAERRVDPDSQAGDAFERMQEYFKEQEEKNGQAKNESGAQDQPGGEAKPGEKNKEGSKEGQGTKPDKQPGDSGKAGDKEENQSGAANEATGEEKPGEAGTSEKTEGGKEGAEASAENPARQPGDEGGAQGTEGPNGNQERPGENQPQTDDPSSKPGEQQQEGNNQPSAANQRQGGAGEEGQKEPKGTPEAQGANKQREKTPDQNQSKPGTEEDQPQSPSNSNHQSDSKGGEEGDQSGGGKSGGGQNAEQDGTGSAGSHTEADDGAGTGKESGEGETDGTGGDDREANGATGDPNAKPTEGAGREGNDGRSEANQQQKHGGQGNKQGGDEPPQNKQPSDQPSNESGKGTQQGHGTPNGPSHGDPTKGSPSEAPSGGQGADDAQPPKPPATAPDLGGDAANEDYANKATDLVLDRLKDQLKDGEPDEALLEKLQWSKDDLRRFVERWEAMKAAAKQPGAQGKKAKEELDEALKSLGLRPRGTATKAGRARQDKIGVRDVRRAEAPAEYADQYRQFSVDASKSK